MAPNKFPLQLNEPPSIVPLALMAPPTVNLLSIEPVPIERVYVKLELMSPLAVIGPSMVV